VFYFFIALLNFGKNLCGCDYWENNYSPPLAVFWGHWANFGVGIFMILMYVVGVLSNNLNFWDR
jgi:hypothetical protein